MGKNKRAKSFYKQYAKKQKYRHSVLSPDMTGFLCMCNGQEKQCVQEAYAILSEFANELYGKEEWKAKKEATEDNVTKEVKETNEGDSAESKPQDDSESEEELDIEAAIKADASQLQKNKAPENRHERRFQQVECGAQNCIFIRTTLEDPLELSLRIMNSIVENKQQRTRKLIRMIPVLKTCRAFPKDIEKTLQTLAKAYFQNESKKYYIAFKIRNNSTIKRDDLTKPIIDIMQEANSENCPDMDAPDVVISVDIIKNVCCLSILPGYFDKYSKYNLLEMANSNKDKKVATEDIVNVSGKTAETKLVDIKEGNESTEVGENE